MEEEIYIVKEGDNLYDIADKYNTTVGILKILNNLESNILKIGQELKIPYKKVEQSPPSDYIIYTIKPGDSLYNIAKRYELSLEELVNFNEQGTTLLKIGEQLLIPVKTSNNDITYIVKPGDTLYNIAKRYNISVEKLKEVNNLDNNMLKIGESLIIPETSNYRPYVVKDNDTLKEIADYYKIELAELKKINNLLTDDIMVGQILLIPNEK